MRNQRGATLIEVLIAIVVLALILASIAPVMLLITRSQYEWNEQRTAESISRNQVEYIKVAPYSDDYEPVPHPETYEVDIYTTTIDGEERLQEITIEIHHADRLVLTTMTYKVKRLEV